MSENGQYKHKKLNVSARDFSGVDFLCMWDRLHGTFLLVVDHVCKWVEAIAYPRNNANTVVGFIQRNIFSRYGAPRTIISDEGSHFAKLLSR